MPQIVRENLFLIHLCRQAKFFHFCPDLFSGQTPPTFCEKNLTGGDFLFFGVLAEFARQFPRNEYGANFSFQEYLGSAFFAASTVIYCTSDTRIPLAQIVSISSPSLSRPVLYAVCSNAVYSARPNSREDSRNIRRYTFRNFNRQSSQSIYRKKPLSAANIELIVTGA